MQSTPNAIAPNCNSRSVTATEYMLHAYLAQGLLTAFALFQKSDQE
jgi:hypothetical protein